LGDAGCAGAAVACGGEGDSWWPALSVLTVYISIPSVTAAYGSALTAAHFWKGPKVSKRPSPHHSAPRLGSVCPHSSLNPWAAATRHPWRGAANPASCRVTHGFKPAFGQRGFTGRRRARARATRFASWIRFLFCVAALLWRAGLPRVGLRSSPKTSVSAAFILASRVIVNDHRGQARLLQGNTFASTTRSAIRPPRFAFDFDLRRPVKHAGRNSAGIWGVNRQGCRFSRPAPWMARGGGPPNHCRITGTPSLGEVPSVGAGAFCLLLRSIKSEPL
jgi:hypothetical protein